MCGRNSAAPERIETGASPAAARRPFVSAEKIVKFHSGVSILLITSVLSLAITYYLKTIYSLALGLIGSAIWWVAQTATWVQDDNIKASAILAGIVFIGLLFYSLGHLHEQAIKWKRFALVYLVIGIISITGILFILSSRAGLSLIEGATNGAVFLNSWQITTSLLLILLMLLGVSIYTVIKKLTSPIEFVAILIIALLFSIIALLPHQNTIFFDFGDQFSFTGDLWAMIFNVVVFLELLGLIFSGYARKEAWLINLGTFFLFLLIIFKYFDWFFTFLDKGIFFIVAGIILFMVGGVMEKGRRIMVINIQEQTKPTP